MTFVDKVMNLAKTRDKICVPCIKKEFGISTNKSYYPFKSTRRRGWIMKIHNDWKCDLSEYPHPHYFITKKGIREHDRLMKKRKARRIKDLKKDFENNFKSQKEQKPEIIKPIIAKKWNYCPNCGQALQDWNFCVNCGYKLSD